MTIEGKVIRIFGEIKYEMGCSIASDILEYCKNKENPNIIFIIDSCGGSTSVYRKIKNALSVSKAKVYTVCFGDAMSTAAMIFTLGIERTLIGKGIGILFHEPGGKIDGKYSDVSVFLKHLKIDYDSFVEGIKSVTDLPREDIKEKIKMDWFITAEEALSLGVATKIAEDISELNIKIEDYPF